MATSRSLLPDRSSNWPLPWKSSVTSLMGTIIEAIPDASLVLDGQRRVLMANVKFLRTFGLSAGTVIGKSPGEALHCLFKGESPDGCGSGLHCSVCGAMRTVLLSQELHEQVVQECQIELGGEDGRSLDLEVTSTYAVIEEMPVTIFVLRDVSLEKHRSVLERLFFHDVLNTVGGIHGVAELLNVGAALTPDQELEYRRWILELSKKLIDEIQGQRKLMAAERGDFTPDFGLIVVKELLREVQALYVDHEVATGRTLKLGNISNSTIISDPQILRRILVNLVKNALEATERAGTVTLGCRDGENFIEFSVHNPGAIPADVQLQLFRRSFTTKVGTGRGIGTYSVKLFGERYLKGKVAFTSTESDGTTFTFRLPKTNPV